MAAFSLEQKIDDLLNDLEAKRIAISELGTPQLSELDVQGILELGSQAVPYLIQLLESENPKKVACIVLALSKTGNMEVKVHLQKLREKYRGRDHKTEWDYAVIGQCNLALQAFDQANQKKRFER